MKGRYRLPNKYEVFFAGKLIDADTFGSFMEKGQMVIVSDRWYMIEKVDEDLKRVYVSEPIDADAAELAWNKALLVKLKAIKAKTLTLDSYILTVTKKIDSLTP